MHDNSLINWLKEIGIDIGLLVSGLFGSLLMLGKHPNASIGASILSIIGGSASANYLTPVVVDFVNITNPRHGYGIAFILGFLGLKGIELVSQRFISKNSELSQTIHEATETKERKHKKPTT